MLPTSAAPLARQLTKKQMKKAAKRAAKVEKKRAFAKAKAKNQDLVDMRLQLKGLKTKKKTKKGGSRLFGSFASGLGKICAKMNPLKVSRSATDSRLNICPRPRLLPGGSAGQLLGTAHKLEKYPALKQQRRLSGALSSPKPLKLHIEAKARGTAASGIAFAAGTSHDDTRKVSPAAKPRSPRSPGKCTSKHPAKLKSSSRSASQPMLIKMISTNVNRFKACPLSLGEKLARWCQVSQMAIFKGHPPEDHFLQFPGCEYSDLLAERRAELAIAGHACELEYDPKKRDECVLKRYPDGRHGLTPYDISLRPIANPKALRTPKLPPPQFPINLTMLGRGASSPELRPRCHKERAAPCHATPTATTTREAGAAAAALRLSPPGMLRRASSDSVTAAQGSCLDLLGKRKSPWDLAGRIATPSAIAELPELSETSPQQ
jgi:hypothetical protein